LLDVSPAILSGGATYAVFGDIFKFTKFRLYFQIQHLCGLRGYPVCRVETGFQVQVLVTWTQVDTILLEPPQEQDPRTSLARSGIEISNDLA
jgi:hypothetical protein